MARLVWLGILVVAVAGWHTVAPLQGAPAWEGGGPAYEVSDLKSVVVSPAALPIENQAPLPPEPAGIEGETLPVPSPAPEGLTLEDKIVPAPEAGPSISERIQRLVPDSILPDGLVPEGLVPALSNPLAYDSAVAIEADGTVVPESKWALHTDWSHCVGDACWTIRFEALALWRNAPVSRPLYTTFDQGTQTAGPVIFNANQFESDPLAAPRLTIARLDECGRGFDASYIYAGTFYSDRSLPLVTNGYAFAAPGIYGNQWGPYSTPISAAQMQLTGVFQSAELNLREPIGWGATRFLLGFRWLQWREKWSMVDQFEDPLNPAITGTDTWMTNTMNNLYGGQIGLDSVLWNTGRGLRLEGVVKAGAYYNAANQSSLYSYTSTAPFAFDRTFTANGPAGAAFAGEVGLTTVIPLRRNLDLRVGYTGIWLTGLAQPTRQLSGQTLTQFDTPSGTLTTNGNVVLQGISLGIEGRW